MIPSVNLVYVLRPTNTSLWLPDTLLKAIGAKHGDRLSDKQFANPRVQDLLRRRRESPKQAPLE